MNQHERMDDQELQRAERAVDSSLHRLEGAMENLGRKVEESSAKLHHVADVADRPRRLARDLGTRAQHLAEQGKDFGLRVRDEVRANPRPYILSAAGVCAGAMLGYLLWRRFRNPYSA
jgi:hypothetical protein